MSTIGPWQSFDLADRMSLRGCRQVKLDECHITSSKITKICYGQRNDRWRFSFQLLTSLNNCHISKARTFDIQLDCFAPPYVTSPKEVRVFDDLRSNADLIVTIMATWNPHAAESFHEGTTDNNKMKEKRPPSALSYSFKHRCTHTHTQAYKRDLDRKTSTMCSVLSTSSFCLCPELQSC